MAAMAQVPFYTAPLTEAELERQYAAEQAADALFMDRYNAAQAGLEVLRDLAWQIRAPYRHDSNVQAGVQTDPYITDYLQKIDRAIALLETF